MRVSFYKKVNFHYSKFTDIKQENNITQKTCHEILSGKSKSLIDQIKKRLLSTIHYSCLRNLQKICNYVYYFDIFIIDEVRQLQNKIIIQNNYYEI